MWSFPGTIPLALTLPYRTRSRHYSGRPSKGNAFEIAKAYQRKKQQEVMRDDEVVKAKKLAKMLNEPDPKASSKKVEPFTVCNPYQISIR